MGQSDEKKIQIELIEYAESCLQDRFVSEYEDYISCQAHKWACMRFLDDIKRSEKDGCWFYWDEHEAKLIRDWFRMLRHSKGALAGSWIELTLWQKFILCQLYGWRRKNDNTRRFRKSFTEVGRKNAKSQMEAGVALYELSVTAAKNGEVAEVYTAGTKREQSKVVFKEAALMLRKSPLEEKFRVTRDTIRHIRSGSEMRPLSKEDGKTGDGSNPALLVIDEYHQHKTTEFYDLGLGAETKEPLMQIITTAGLDLTCPCYTAEYSLAKKILDPANDAEDDEYLIDILELDPEDYKDITKLSDRRKWWKANPIRMSYEKGRNSIESAYKTASEQPEHMTAFLTKMLDVWVMARENGYMDMKKWKDCEVAEEDLPDTVGLPVYVGFDMSSKLDLTSVAFVIPFRITSFADKEEGESVVKYIVYSHSFIPSVEKLQEHIAKDKMPYDQWERMGLLTVTDTPIVDQNAVMQYVIAVCEKRGWKIQCLCFDPANASKLMMDLSDEGYDVEEVFQSHKSLNESTQGFREQVACRNIMYTHNPLLNYAMSNAVVRRNNGLIKIDKDATTKRVDPVDALLCAYKLAMYHEFEDDYGSYLDRFIEELQNGDI